MNVFAMYGIIIFVIGLVIWRRMRETVRPIHGSGIKILLPIIYLLPLISLFSNAPLQLELWEVSVASLIGVFLAVPLILTTNYEIRKDGQIYAQRNTAFFIVLLAVLAIRIVLRQFFSEMDSASLAVLFFSVAFCYVALWRISSFVKFRKVKQVQTLGACMISS